MGTAPLSGWEEVCWRIIPTDTPRVIRRCPQCNESRRFVSTGKFRLNAQQRRIDVWLLYRCMVCDTTWKRPLFERYSPEEIGNDLYERLLRNDARTAEAYVFDVTVLRRAGVDVDDAVPVRVEATAQLRPSATGGWRITLDIAYPCSVRLDRLLAQTLSVSRLLIHRWADDGRLGVLPGDRRALRRPVRHGQILLVSREAFSPPVEPPAGFR